jgi:hypothetical protein
MVEVGSSFRRCFAAAALLSLSAATATAADSNIEDTPPPILGTAHLLLHQKLEAGPTPFGPLEQLLAGDGYITIKYSIGTPGQRKNLTDWIKYLASSLPQTIGNTDGTYVVTLHITAANNKALDIHEPILAIQWTTQRAFLFFDTTVNDVSKTEWNGTLIDQMLISDTNSKLKFSVEVSLHKNRSLDFSFLSQASQTGKSTSLISLLPLPAAASALISSISTIVNNIYSSSTSDDVVNTEEIDASTPSTKVAALPIESSGKTTNLPIYLSIVAVKSRLVEGGLTNGKFDKNKILETLFDKASVSIGTDKPISVAELLATAADDGSKKVRPFLNAIAEGGAYTKGDLGNQCGNLVAALESYLSKADARAAFWAFLQRYSAQVDRDKCLGTGNLRSELSNLGLTF